MYRIFCIASFVITIALSSLAAQGNGVGQIYNVYTDLCLEPTDLSDGAAIVQRRCNSDFAQGWVALWASDNIVIYENNNNAGYSGRLDARGPAANRTPSNCGHTPASAISTGNPENPARTGFHR
jgi:hypothetical protein